MQAIKEDEILRERLREAMHAARHDRARPGQDQAAEIGISPCTLSRILNG